MKLQPNQAPRAASIASTTITRARRPARMMTSAPATAVSAAVPTSGWMATSPTGTRISTPSAPNEDQPGGSGRSCRYQAHIIGTASFISSEGWKRNSPKFSQRRAPMPTWPIVTTSMSSTHPPAYNHGVLRRRKFGFTRARAAVLLQHCERDARLIGGREGDEPGMIAQPLADQLGVVLLGARDREHLGSAGLAGEGVGRVCADSGGGAALRDPDHAVHHALPVLGRDAGHLAVRQRGDAMQLPGARIAVSRDHARPPDLAAHRDDAGIVRQLDRRDGKVPLADAEAHRLSREPHAVLRTRERLLLPLARGQDPGLLAADVDAGRLAKAERSHERGHAVDPDLVGEAVEVDIARARDGIVEIDRAVMLVVVFTVDEGAARQMERAGAVAVRQRVHHVIGEPGECDHRLHGRARRIGSAQRAVEQRAVDVVLQGAVLARGNAAAEYGRIEARQADERDHVAVVRIERHDRTAMPGERGFRGALHLEVDRQQQILTGSRRPGAQVGDEGTLALHRASLRVDENLAKAVGAMQLTLVGTLDAELAHEGGAGVGRAVDVLQILLADGAHIAERVHRQLPVGVPAGLACLDIQARKLETPHGETRDVLVRHAQADRHAVEAAAGVDGALELIDVPGTDRD